MRGVSVFPPEPRTQLLPRPETLPQPAPAPLMTLRVSRDSGRTWGPRRHVYGGEPLMTSVWPPCACPRCQQDT